MQLCKQHLDWIIVTCSRCTLLSFCQRLSPWKTAQKVRKLNKIDVVPFFSKTISGNIKQCKIFVVDFRCCAHFFKLYLVTIFKMMITISKWAIQMKKTPENKRIKPHSAVLLQKHSCVNTAVILCHEKCILSCCILFVYLFGKKPYFLALTQTKKS